jgi:hypothetical protein
MEINKNLTLKIFIKKLLSLFLGHGFSLIILHLWFAGPGEKEVNPKSVF